MVLIPFKLCLWIAVASAGVLLFPLVFAAVWLERRRWTEGE